MSDEIKDDLKVLADGVLKEISTEFKEQSQEVLGELLGWAKIIAQIKYEIARGGDDKKLAELRRSEEYAWAGLQSLKARHAIVVESKVWPLIERLLILVKKVFLA